MSSYVGTVTGVIVGVIGAAFDVVLAFGGHVTPQEKAAVIALATAVVPTAPLIGVAVDHLRHVKKQATGGQ